jgi:hypothetical protein
MPESPLTTAEAGIEVGKMPPGNAIFRGFDGNNGLAGAYTPRACGILIVNSFGDRSSRMKRTV